MDHKILTIIGFNNLGDQVMKTAVCLVKSSLKINNLLSAKSLFFLVPFLANSLLAQIHSMKSALESRRFQQED